MRFTLEPNSAFRGEEIDVALTMSSDAPVQGLVAAFEWDGGALEGVDLDPGLALDDADTVVRRVGSSFMVLGMVFDTDLMGPIAIPPGADIRLASARVRCITGDIGPTAIRFADGLYATIDGGAALDNVAVVDGLSLGDGGGLTLVDGQVDCLGVADDLVFRIGSGETASDSCGLVEVLLDNPSVGVEGYEIAIAHPPELSLQTITIADTAAEEFGAEFAVIDVLPEGGTLGVIMDLVAPFEGNVIPPGQGRVVARYTYCCESMPIGDVPPEAHELRFVDGELGEPAKNNTVVIAGKSFTPTLVNGTFTCIPVGEACRDGVDNDGDGLVDCEDPDCVDNAVCQKSAHVFALGARRLDAQGLPDVLVGDLGQTIELSFFYKSPEDNIPGGPQFDQVQGLSQVVCYPCSLSVAEDSFSTVGTIVEAVGADFVNFQADNDPDDGDGCELILAILVDTLPPFDGATLPPTNAFFRLGSADLTIGDQPGLCGECLPIEFCDGANGRGRIPLRNLVAAENHSFSPQVMGTEVCVFAEERFHRGDCDFSGRLNIADAAELVLFLFARGRRPGCLDACDTNDDGRLNIVDAAAITLFLFANGTRPPAPGPGFVDFQPVPTGVDPTPDGLDCIAGRVCAI